MTRNLTDLYPTIRELYGESTGNAAAKQIAEGVQKAQELGRRRFNAAGGDIVERQDFGITIRHDQSRVAAVHREEWADFVQDLLDDSKMLNESGHPMTKAEIRVGLRRAYDSIASGGLTDTIGPIGRSIYGSSVNARAAHRFLSFKNADSWIQYHQRFGDGNVYNHVNGTFDKLARDIATLEVLGPHPEATLRFMEDQIDIAAAQGALSKTGRAGAKSAGAIGGPKTQLKALFNTVTGRTALASNGVVASVSQANRNLLVAATLGSAFLSAIADTPLLALTARVNGMSPMRAVARHMRLFATNSKADRLLAIRLGFTAQGWSDRAIAAQRVLGESVGPEWSEKMTDTVLRATLLSPWTEAGRYGFQLEMLGHITGQAGKTFDQLDAATRGSFERHGIDAADWEIIRNTEQWRDPDSGAQFIRAEDVSGDEFGSPRFNAANKLQQAIFNETQFAVITANPRVRAVLTGGAPAGTFWGEVMRNTALFKGFPVTVLYMHFNRLMAQKGITKKAEYAAWLVLGMTAFGALGEQMNNIATGKNPANMNPGTEEGRKFASRAIMRGGALGLFGDLVLNDANRWGGGVFSSLLGPVARQGEDAFKLAAGNIQQVLAGEETNVGRETSRFIQSLTPGRSGWYTKLVMERILFDQLDYALDPKAAQSFRKVEQRAKQDFNQKYFFRPGKLTPDSAPDLSQAFQN